MKNLLTTILLLITANLAVATDIITDAGWKARIIEATENRICFQKRDAQTNLLIGGNQLYCIDLDTPLTAQIDGVWQVTKPELEAALAQPVPDNRPLDAKAFQLFKQLTPEVQAAYLTEWDAVNGALKNGLLEAAYMRVYSLEPPNQELADFKVAILTLFQSAMQ